MIILLKQSLYTKKSSNKEKKHQILDDALIVGGTAITGGSLASRKVRGRLTGKVVRYHNTEKENVASILEEGLKASKANNPASFTRYMLRAADNDHSLDNKVYTSKTKRVANGVGASKEMQKGNIIDAFNEQKHPTKHKTLKIILDYEKDIKGSKRVDNPELLGAKNWKEYHERRLKQPFEIDAEQNSKDLFKGLGEETHIFDHDIDSSKIVGGKGYKRRSLKDVKNYIKNNPKRFLKGAIPVAIGGGLLTTGIVLKKKHKKANNTKEN